ncbi:protein mel-28 [Bactrocera tryoni]|uniref:protein mel-28 n=1 Tax=Bactrocera tryoni TaxID=59916 RepID=UPI001A9735F0|nr:protein mel-28 [Bactrocera tryoni]XP_039966709.1 protein mel-28 [Bactrocera tryoni]
MSTKATTQHTRRAPLSLSGGGKQQSQNHYSGKSAESNGSSNNSASAKNDNKHSASQKTESSVNDVKESTPKDLKKPQNTDKKQQQQSANNESVKKNEKTDEKKTQNGSVKASTNGGAKEKQQNGSDKQDNNSNSNSTNAKTVAANSNGNANAKTNAKSNEKAAPPTAKEDTKTKEPKLAEPVEKSEKEPEKEKDKEMEKKKESEPEKVVEKETRSRRHEAVVATEVEKKQADKKEANKGDETKMEVTTPTSRSSAGQAKSRATPTKGVEKSGRSTPTKPVDKPTASPRIKTVTTVIDDVEMEPPAVETSPAKSKENTSPVVVAAAAAASVLQPPAATSTPGKATTATQKTKPQTVDAKSDQPINAPSCGSSPDRKSVPRTITHIGGRRSIRPLNEYTPSKFQSNLQFRESYRRINTELDVSSTTNTSMNVTVGSEVPNNSSFSFFGRGRKRDRTPPRQTQSTMELQTDADYSPPKRARLDMYSLFSVVSSPLTMLRSRFSRASIQSSTPVKLATKLAATDEDEADVQNVSGISIEEENATDGGESDEKTATEDVTVGKNTDDDTTPKMDSPMKVDEKCGMEKGDEVNDELEDASKSSNVHEVAAGIADTSVSSAKNKRCHIM